MKLLALDFDGVISDSAAECFWVALRTYVDLRPRCSFAGVLHELGDEGSSRKAIENEPLYQRFLEFMPLGNRSEDFGVSLALLEREISLDSQAAYDEERSRQPESFLTSFHERFYEVRHASMERTPKDWLELMGPYRPFTTLLLDRGGEVDLAVATAKDRRSVLHLLASYGLETLIPPERVIDKQAGISKRAHIESLQQRTGVSPSEITFVDDKVSHLDDIAPLGARCVLATWGYNGGRERELAAGRGYLLCTLENAGTLLFE